VAAIFLGMPLYWRLFPPRLPIEVANGVHASSCCGSFELRNGLMFFGKHQQIRYVVEHDKVGRYMLPAQYVRVIDGKQILADPSKSQMYLRLDDSTKHTAIELNGGSTSYEFQRQ
jgi:hypothetical protein